MDMRLRWREVDMTEMSGEIEFGFYIMEEDALVDGVEQFKYLGRPLDQTYDNWSAVHRTVRQAKKVWGRLVKMLQREGAETKVLAMLYRAVVQEVLLFGLESWFLLAEIDKKLEGDHTGSL